MKISLVLIVLLSVALLPTEAQFFNAIANLFRPVTNALNNLDIHSQHQHTSQNQVPAVFEPELPLSRAPSPFLSEEKYKSCHEAWQAQKLADFKQKHAVINVKKVFLKILTYLPTYIHRSATGHFDLIPT